MQVGNTPQGALMAKWVGYSGLSELHEWVGDQLHWIFPHPSITTDDPHWLIAWRLQWNGLTNALARYTVRLRWSYHEAGTEWGYYDAPNSAWDATLSSGGTLAFSSATWNVIDPVEFEDGGSVTNQILKRATWAQMPEFHPYRTRP